MRGEGDDHIAGEDAAERESLAGAMHVSRGFGGGALERDGVVGVLVGW